MQIIQLMDRDPYPGHIDVKQFTVYCTITSYSRLINRQRHDTEHTTTG